MDRTLSRRRPCPVLARGRGSRTASAAFDAPNEGLGEARTPSAPSLGLPLDSPAVFVCAPQRSALYPPALAPMNIPCPRLLAAALTLVAGAGLPLAPLQAQTAPEPQKLDAFVVTGSYIPSTEAAVEAG